MKFEDQCQLSWIVKKIVLTICATRSSNRIGGNAEKEQRFGEYCCRKVTTELEAERKLAMSDNYIN